MDITIVYYLGMVYGYNYYVLSRYGYNYYVLSRYGLWI